MNDSDGWDKYAAANKNLWVCCIASGSSKTRSSKRACKEDSVCAAVATSINCVLKKRKIK
jgi:hypothetical protein